MNKRRSHRAISGAGNVRGRKTREEGGESSETRDAEGRERGAERVKERSRVIREEEIQGKWQIRSRRDREKQERETGRVRGDQKVKGKKVM